MLDAVVRQTAARLELAAGGQKAVASSGHALRLLELPPHAVDAVPDGNIQGDALRAGNGAQGGTGEAVAGFRFRVQHAAVFQPPARGVPVRAGCAQKPGRPWRRQPESAGKPENPQTRLACTPGQEGVHWGNNSR